MRFEFDPKEDSEARKCFCLTHLGNREPSEVFALGEDEKVESKKERTCNRLYELAHPNDKTKIVIPAC